MSSRPSQPEELNFAEFSDKDSSCRASRSLIGFQRYSSMDMGSTAKLRVNRNRSAHESDSLIHACQTHPSSLSRGPQFQILYPHLRLRDEFRPTVPTIVLRSA